MSIPYSIARSICVLIPVRNEEDTITAVIQSLQELGLNTIRVVDNGSIDRSADYASQAGAEVFHEPIPGYGRACWCGLQDLPAEIDWILFCDGDGSDELGVIPEWVTMLLDSRPSLDLILGDRRATVSGRAVMTPAQNFGNRLATWMIRWGWGMRYHDLGPMRLIRRSALEAIQMKDRGFGWTVEMQVRSVELGLQIREVPVGYRPRQGGRSKISGTIIGSIRAGHIILQTLGTLYLRRLLRRSPISTEAIRSRQSDVPILTKRS